MKGKRLAAVFLILMLCFSASLAGTLKYIPVGSAEEIISAAAVYCNKWHELIGSALGYDMAFNENNVTVIQQKHYDMGGNRVTTFDMDGIQVDVDDDLTIYAIQIPVLSGTKEQYASTARIFAVVNALAFNYPSSDAEMSQRYMGCLSEYLDFMEENKDKLAAGDIVYWKINTDKGEFEFQFIAVNGRLRMMYDNAYIED